MNELTVFNFESQPVRIHVENSDTWFCLNDVCDVLEIKDRQKLRARLNKRGMVLIPAPSRGGIQKTYFINEPNLYKTILRSDKPQARKFEDWVCDEVLPAIRKTGSYAVPQNNSVINIDIIKESIKTGIKDLFCPYRGGDSYYNVGDADIVQYMQRWYWTRHKAILQALDEKDEKIRELESKLNRIKAVI